MTEQEIKLLPPIKGPFRYDELGGGYIWDANGRMIANVRGWGWIQYMDDPEERQDTLGKFLAEALTEKLQRELGSKEDSET